MNVAASLREAFIPRPYALERPREETSSAIVPKAAEPERQAFAGRCVAPM